MSDDAALLALLRVLEACFSSGGPPPHTLGLCKDHPEWGGHDKVFGLCKSLQAREYVSLKQKEKTLWLLTAEGERYAAEGTPEFKLLCWMQEHHEAQGHDVTSLKAAFGADTDVALSNAMKLGWLKMDKGTKRIQPKDQGTQGDPKIADLGSKALQTIREWHVKDAETDEDTEQQLHDMLRKVDASKQPDRFLQELKKRKLVETKKLKFCSVERAEKFQVELKKPLADLDAKVIASGSWKHQELKPYNFFARGTRLRRGAIHPLMAVQKQFKHVLTAMGFEEMDTNQYVDPSFWCFDSLFMPQQHPARDVQDTFFIKSPEYANGALMEKDYIARVKEMHERGGQGSIGWQYDWSLDESLKNIMRTHTTSVSARMLYQMGQEYKKTGVFTPKKLFSIDRVFRNETLDATHLAEFHQVEGVVAGRGLSLGHLMGVMNTFYKAIGIEKLKFKPAFNPYTEPSMEIFGFHPGLSRWIEVGNSGVFRPEMLLPMDLPPDVTVIAWGLSLERPTMIKYGISNIRELFGSKALLGGV